MKDEVIEEIRAIRRQIMDECGNDVHRYAEYLRASEAEMKKQGRVTAAPFVIHDADAAPSVLREDTGK
ncbi:MAG: hypothetical protein ABIZ56_12485 [Chthoniobacteraceae bacterium]